MNILMFALGHWKAIVFAVIVASLCAATAYWHREYQSEHAAFEKFKLDVAVAGAKQNQRAIDDSKAQLRVTERATYEGQRFEKMYSARVADLRDQLRKQASDPGVSILPRVPGPPATDPDRVCFSRDAFNRRFEESFGRLQERLVTIAEKGDRAREYVRAVVSWAHDQKDILK